MQSQNVIFVSILGVILLAASFRAFRRLPRAGGQMLAAIPIKQCGTAVWTGLNLTGYGLYNAIAFTLAATIAFLLLGSIGISPLTATLVLLILIAACVPASRIVARIVEGKQHTLTVGGASFIGILLAPWLVLLAGRLSGMAGTGPLPATATLASFAIAYAFGEGIGRLACISFGCCYGCPISNLPPRLQQWMAPLAFRFSGNTRKIAYAGNLEDTPVIPIQAITNVLYTGTALAAMLLFLHGHFATACIASLLVTQIWRILSEWLRADYRGNLRFSAYQRMSLISIPYISIILLFLPNTHPAPAPVLCAGLQALWQPGILLALQALFVFAFLFTGRSGVTASTIKFYVCKDKI
jgi:hypothetical protein